MPAWAGARCRQWMGVRGPMWYRTLFDRESEGRHFSCPGTFGIREASPQWPSVAAFLQFHGSEIGVLQTNAP